MAGGMRDLGKRQGSLMLSIQGGLGNQLFEWAFGRSLSARGRRVVFDTVRCRGNRPLEIGKLLPLDRRLSKPLGYAVAATHRAGLLREARHWANPLQLMREPGYSYDPHFIDRLMEPRLGACYVLGYFQSPKYFLGLEEEIRREAGALLTGMLSPRGKQLTQDLSTDPHSVAVHVRRGDYVSSVAAAGLHGVLVEDYYAEALTRVHELGHERILWFSDDPSWVLEKLARPQDTVVTAELSREFTTAAGGEIALMASCACRVIANSSFSWWAGWLGSPSTTQTPVMAPARWFASGYDNAVDLIPASWLRF